MSSFQFAIASIVDANTGNGLSHGTGGINFTEAERRGRRIRAKSVLSLLKRIGRRVIGSLTALRLHRENQHNIQLVSQLSDRLLDDIGFDRGDVIAAQIGQIDFPQLEARRISNLEIKSVQLHDASTAIHAAALRNAANEPIFTPAKCA